MPTKVRMKAVDSIVYEEYGREIGEWKRTKRDSERPSSICIDILTYTSSGLRDQLRLASLD